MGEGPQEKVRGRRAVIKGPPEKVQRRKIHKKRSVEEGPREKVHRRKREKWL